MRQHRPPGRPALRPLSMRLVVCVATRLREGAREAASGGGTGGRALARMPKKKRGRVAQMLPHPAWRARAPLPPPLLPRTLAALTLTLSLREAGEAGEERGAAVWGGRRK